MSSVSRDSRAIPAPPAARTPAMRRLVAETSLRPGDLVLPLFVKEGITEPQPIGSMPGVVQHTRDSLRKAAAEAVARASAG
jgi:porphobilinogen synthase